MAAKKRSTGKNIKTVFCKYYLQMKLFPGNNKPSPLPQMNNAHI